MEAQLLHWLCHQHIPSIFFSSTFFSLTSHNIFKAEGMLDQHLLGFRVDI